MKNCGRSTTRTERKGLKKTVSEDSIKAGSFITKNSVRNQIFSNFVHNILFSILVNRYL